MYFDLLTNDADQLDLQISPHGRHYIKFSNLHPSNDPQTILQTECERFRTFYSINARTQNEVWSQKRITNILRYGSKVQSMFDLDYLLYRYFIYRNKKFIVTISDSDIPSINPNDIFTISAHLKDCQTSESSIGAYNIAISILKD